MARWITVRKPFDYRWPGRSAITTFREADLGEHMVKDEVADFAVGNGYATEGKVDGSARSRKSGPKRQRTRRKKETAPAETADTGSGASMGDEDVPDADRAAGGASVDQPAS